MGHTENFSKRAASAKLVPRSPPPKEERVPGRMVRVFWVDRDTNQPKQTMQVEADRWGRLPLEFVKLTWGVTNLYWRDTQLLIKVMDDGFSATGVGPTVTNVHLYADNNPTPIPPSVSTPVLLAEEVMSLPVGNFSSSFASSVPVVPYTPVFEETLPAPVRIPSNSVPQPSHQFQIEEQTLPPPRSPSAQRPTALNFCSNCGAKASSRQLVV